MADLDKRTIAEAPERFLSDEFDASTLMTIGTSGTTGTPLTVRFTKQYHQMEMAFRWRHKAWGGCPFLSRGAYVSGHPVVPSRRTRPPFWRVDYAERRLLCSSYHLIPAHFPAYAAAFRRFRPDFIHGYPSSLFLLDGYTPKALFTASETLLDFQRARIESAFGAKVFNWYGNTEFTCNIIECAHGNLHCRSDYGVLELQDDGAMVVTGLNNRAMPLIRYRVGDRAVASVATCTCGCAFPLIESIEGRVEEYVHTPDGRLVGRLDHLFKDVRHVREAQLEQTRLDELVVRLVRTAEFGAHDEAVIRDEARQRLGDGITLRFHFVDVICARRPGSSASSFRSCRRRRDARARPASIGFTARSQGAERSSAL